MKKNIGSADRAIRILLAIVFAVLFFTDTATGILGIILLVLAVVLLLTSLMSFCPLYTPLKISTNKQESK